MKQKQFGSIRSFYIFSIMINQLVTFFVILAIVMLLEKTTNIPMDEIGLSTIAAISFVIIMLASTFTGITLSRPLSRLRTKLLQLKSLNQIDTNFSESDISTTSGLVNYLNTALEEVVDSTTDEVHQTKKAEQFYKNLLDQLSVGVVVLNKDQDIQLANEAAQATLGIQGKKNYEKNISKTLPLTIYGRQFLGNWLDENSIKSTDAVAHWQDIELKNSKDELRYLEVVAKNYATNQSGFDTVLLLIDRTEEQQEEDRKLDFIAIAAHELRAPITIISGYLQVFDEELQSTLNEEQKSFMSKMRVSAEQLASFINNILSVSKIEQGEVNIQQQELNINDIIEQNREILELRAATHGKKIEFKLAKDIPTAAIDPSILPTVISNLVGNAIKYTENNGRIKLITQKNEATGDIEVLVEDNGIGIPAANVGNLFTKFYRSHRSKNQFGGSGIGLFLCKSIIDAHNGKIWVNTTEGEGSTFAFSIPNWKEFKKDDSPKQESQITRTGHGWIKNHSMYRR